jgi:hypothetical protein
VEDQQRLLVRAVGALAEGQERTNRMLHQIVQQQQHFFSRQQNQANNNPPLLPPPDPPAPINQPDPPPAAQDEDDDPIHVVDPLGHHGVQVPLLQPPPPPTGPRNVNDALRNRERVQAYLTSLPQSMVVLLRVWRGKRLDQCRSSAAKRHWPTPNKTMFSKWLYLYSHLEKKAQEGYPDGRFPAELPVQERMSKMDEAAMLMDADCRERSLDSYMKALKRMDTSVKRRAARGN